MDFPNMDRRTFLAGLFGTAMLSIAACSSGQQVDEASESSQGASEASGTNQGANEASQSEASASSTASVAGSLVRVGSLTGPTSIGLVDLMERAEADQTTNNYEFTMAGTADEIVPLLIKGKLDIALLPANACSVLWNKTEGNVCAIDINTLGVLSLVTGDANIASFEDLAGRTVYMTGKGQTPEYVMNYLLSAASIADQVTLEFKSEPAEVVSVLAATPEAVGVLPQPFVTAACTKNPALSAPVSLTDVWDASVTDKSRMVTGATVAHKSFIDANPDALHAFLEDHAASVNAVNADPSSAAALVVKRGIIEAEAVAQKAIPNCSLVCITGSEMHDALSGYLSVLASEDPSSVGGKLPSEDFYYLG